MTIARAATFPYWPGSIFGLVPQRCPLYKGTRDNPETETPTVLELGPVLMNWSMNKRAKEGYETPLIYYDGAGGARRLLGHVRMETFWVADPDTFKVVLRFVGTDRAHEVVRERLERDEHHLSVEVLNDEVESVAIVPTLEAFTQLPRT